MRRRNKNFGRTSEDLVELPWQLEGVLLVVIPIAAGAAFWRIWSEVVSRAEVISEAIGVRVDPRPVLMAASETMLWVSIILGIGVYVKVRRWLSGGI